MAAPGILTGSDNRTSLFRTVEESAEPTNAQLGVFGLNPGATPKYARNRGPVDAEYRESMARLFIAIPPDQVESFLNTVSVEARPLARALAGGGSSGGGGGTGFIDFILTDAHEDMRERAQIVDTLTDNYVAFYSGHEPPVFQYSGYLLNTYQDDQRVSMLRIYHEILRGTRLANRNLIVNLRYDSFLVTGYMEQLRMTLSGEQDNSAGRFSFSLRVKQLSVITPSLTSPTVVNTPAVSSSMLEALYSSTNNVNSADTERIATVTPDQPPTPISVPNADPTDPRESEATREELEAAGLSDAEITAVLEESVAQSEAAGDNTGPEVQQREQAVQMTTEGVDRIGRAVSAQRSAEVPVVQTPEPPPFSDEFIEQALQIQAAGGSRATAAQQLQREAQARAERLASIVGVSGPSGDYIPVYDDNGRLTGRISIGSPANPGNVSADGNKGMTNVRGTLGPSSDVTQNADLIGTLGRRSGERSRGRASPNPSGSSDRSLLGLATQYISTRLF